MTQKWKKEDVNHTGESWYAHKTDSGEWCNGKEKKPYTPNQALQSTALAQIQVALGRIEKRLDGMALYLKDNLSQSENLEEKANVPF